MKRIWFFRWIQDFQLQEIDLRDQLMPARVKECKELVGKKEIKRKV